MKKTFTIVLAVALAGFTSRAQDSQMANHLALGITLGLDGIGLEAALPVSPYVQARAGYSIFPYTYKQDPGLRGGWRADEAAGQSPFLCHDVERGHRKASF